MTIHIRRMTAADIPAGMKLKEQNLWNTTPEDWQRQLDLEPDGCFAAEADGQVVGTACACVFDSVAWVNLVLVGEVHRGRGIGTSLMRTVLAWLDDLAVPSIRLDATPLGRPIYEKLGFAAEYELTRYEGTIPAALPAGAIEAVTMADVADLAELSRLDQRVTSTNRDKLIRYLYQQLNLFVARRSEEIVAYAAFRPGSRARHIGPCLGEAAGCRQLIGTLCQLLRCDVVFMDVPVDHAEANGLAASIGLTPQRRLTRMGRGARIHELLDQYWCSFGPEKG
jgi:GNAT superfamily N-acetyltransferase